MKKLFHLSLAVFFLFAVTGAFAEGGKVESTKANKAVETKKADDTKKVDMKKYEKRKADNPEIAIQTDLGVMNLELFRDVAPIHVDSMLSLIRKKFYDGLTFHRVIDGFMIQGGDPKGNGSGDAGYNLPAEFSAVKHLEGTLSMARSADPNSASCQFFICLAPTPFLDGKYTIFGHLMEGYDVLHKIGSTKVAGEKPVQDMVIRKMTILKDVAPKSPAK
ncbi:MAG: peptidylprolyl isomerase [candidate division Zixibacteria bacterium]|nr:peptidylprolyl isomerase [candidate division Zixibacteria bacterium]